jgi:hypothetical protein
MEPPSRASSGASVAHLGAAPWRRGVSPPKNPRPPLPTAGSSEDPFLASLAQAEARDSQALRVPKPLAAIETAEDDDGALRRHHRRQRRTKHSSKSPLVKVVVDPPVVAPTFDPPLTRSARRSGITPLLDGLGMQPTAKSAWPLPVAAAAASSSEAAAETSSVELDDDAPPRRSRTAVLPRMLSAKPKNPSTAKKKAAAPTSRAASATKGKSPIKKGKKPAAAKTSSLLVPYTMPHGEVIFVRSADLAQLSGVDGRVSRSQLKNLLEQMLQQ